MESDKLTPRGCDVMLLRMVPFVERNCNMVELPGGVDDLRDGLSTTSRGEMSLAPERRGKPPNTRFPPTQ